MPETRRFLEGPFAPVSDEVTAYDLPVTGRIPAGLNGRYLRNGPNPLGLDDPNYHWFLGAGMVHGVRLRDGNAEWYRNRWVRSKAVAAAHNEAWPGGPVHENMDFAANTHVIGHAGRTLATVEGGALPYELSYELDTVGPCDFAGTLPGGFAAHTKLDHRTGCRYDDSFDVSAMWAAQGPVTLNRWTIDPATGTVAQQRLHDRWQEFPRVDDRIISRPHRFGYSAVIGDVERAVTADGEFADDAFANALLRHDLVGGTTQTREFGRAATVGEAVFAPSSPDAAEDDGYVMAFVHNPERGASDLILLAAQDFTGDPVATVQLPARIPLGFHGNWIPDRH